MPTAVPIVAHKAMMLRMLLTSAIFSPQVIDTDDLNRCDTRTIRAAGRRCRPSAQGTTTIELFIPVLDRLTCFLFDFFQFSNKLQRGRISRGSQNHFFLMQLEHKTKQVVSNAVFAKRMLKYLGFSMGLVLFSVAIGMLGYHHFGGLEWLDSFHMACMILTGMGPVSDMTTEAAKWFSSFYALYSGVAFLSITAVFFAPVIHRILHILHVEDDL